MAISRICWISGAKMAFAAPTGGAFKEIRSDGARSACEQAGRMAVGKRRACITARLRGEAPAELPSRRQRPPSRPSVGSGAMRCGGAVAQAVSADAAESPARRRHGHACHPEVGTCITLYMNTVSCWHCHLQPWDCRGYAGAERLAGSPEVVPVRRLYRGASFLSGVIISWWGCCIAEKRFRNMENDACCFAAFFLNMRKNISHTEI